MRQIAIKLTLPQLKALSAACDEYGTGLADNPGTGTELRVLRAAQTKVDQAMAEAMSANGPYRPSLDNPYGHQGF